MRDTKTLFDTFEDIKTLCQYLYMSEDHEILIHNMINVPLRIYMNDDLEIVCQNMNFPELEPMHLSDATPSKLHDIVCCLKEEPALNFRYVCILKVISAPSGSPSTIPPFTSL